MENFKLIKSNDTLDSILEFYKNSIDKQFIPYRNHCYRVFNYSNFLNNYNEEEVFYFAVATAFHDIAIWTSNTFDYIDPSIELAMDFLKRSNRLDSGKIISIMIDEHHKITTYSGEYREIVENFRKADWTDVSFGLSGFITKSVRKEVESQFPNSGFHSFLGRKSLENFIQNPLKPLPFFKL